MPLENDGSHLCVVEMFHGTGQRYRMDLSCLVMQKTLVDDNIVD